MTNSLRFPFSTCYLISKGSLYWDNGDPLPGTEDTVRFLSAFGKVEILDEMPEELPTELEQYPRRFVIGDYEDGWKAEKLGAVFQPIWHVNERYPLEGIAPF